MRFTAACFATLSVTLSLCGSAFGADLHVTPSTFSSAFGTAKAGDTLHLAAGNYGTFTGAMKSGLVTITPEPGATVSMAVDFNPAANIKIDGLQLGDVELADSRTHDITVANSDVAGQTIFRTGQLANANILFDHNVHANWSKCSGCSEARVWLPEQTSQPSGITIQNSQFGPGGMSDGIQNGSNGTKILNNVFFGLKEGSVDGVHTDAIQLYGSSNTVIRGNYFHDVPDAIMAPDGADHELIENNVFAAGDSFDYPFAITIWGDNGSIIRHNTMLYDSCAFNLNCGIISIGAKSGDPAGHGTIIRDNILTGIACCGDNGATYSADHNLTRQSVAGANSIGTPTYSGGVHPTTFAGFALAAGSAGRGTASDGTDVGADVTGTSTPAPTAPDTVITAGPTGTTSDDTPMFTFTATATPATFGCRVDTGAWTACTTPWTPSALADGAHTVEVRATDASGNVDPSPAARAFTVDTTTPGVPAAAVWTAPQNVMVGQAVTLDGTGSAGDAPLSCTWTFEDQSGSTVFDTRTGCAIQMTFASSGTKYVRLSVADANGDTSADRQSFTVAAASSPDTTPPDTTITGGPAGLTSSRTPSFTFGSTEAGSTFRCRVDAGSWGSCTSPRTVAALADGAHTFAVRATDAAGNTDASAAARTFTVDGTAPETTIISSPAASTTDLGAAVTFTANEAGAAFECRLDGGAWIPCTSPYAVGGLALGTHTVAVRAADAAGNVESTPASVSWTIVSPLMDPPPADAPAPSSGGKRSGDHSLPPSRPIKRVTLRAASSVTVRGGHFMLACGTVCAVKVTATLGGRTFTVARGRGDRIDITRAGRRALSRAGRKGLGVAVRTTAGAIVERSRTKLKLG